jgi:hypothetical protein
VSSSKIISDPHISLPAKNPIAGQPRPEGLLKWHVPIDYFTVPIPITVATPEFILTQIGQAVVLQTSGVVQGVITLAFHPGDVAPMPLFSKSMFIFKRPFERLYLSWAAQAIAGTFALYIFGPDVLESADIIA